MDWNKVSTLFQFDICNIYTIAGLDDIVATKEELTIFYMKQIKTQLRFVKIFEDSFSKNILKYLKYLKIS